MALETTNGVPVCPNCKKPTKRAYDYSNYLEFDLAPIFNEEGININPNNISMAGTWYCYNCKDVFFVPLPKRWWEGKTLSEMPEYIRLIGDWVYLCRWEQDADGNFWYCDHTEVPGTRFMIHDGVLPATEEEYNNRLSTPRGVYPKL